MKITRRKLLTAVATPIVGGIGVAGYGFLWESGWLRVREYDVPIKGLGQPLSLLHLSDMHAGGDVPWSLIEKGITLGIDLEPDLICVTGDFITHKLSGKSRYATLLKRLADHAPTYAVLGNHDGGKWAAGRGYSDTSVVRDILATAGITLLHNTSVEQSGLQLVGLGDLWAKECKPFRAWSKPAAPQSPTVVLSHNPDSKDTIPYPYELMLCGHTHGGQLRVPFSGATPFAPVRDHRFVDGLCSWKQRHIHITRGIGNLMNTRLNCRPEVSLLHLKPA